METKEEISKILAGSGTKKDPYTYGSEGSRSTALDVIEEASKEALDFALQGANIHFLLDDQPFYIKLYEGPKRQIFIGKVEEDNNSKPLITPATLENITLVTGNFTAAATAKMIIETQKKSIN